MENLYLFFKWNTVINLSLVMLSGILFIIFKKNIIKIHTGLFGLSEEKLTMLYISFFGMYKLFIIFFNVVPFIALTCLNH